MGKTNLGPGFRFHPTDVELVRYYLKRKVMGKNLRINPIAEIDIYKFEPPDLPDKSCSGTGDLKWYFFCPREKKYSKSCKANRSTEFGYWKTSGRDRDVSYNNEVVGRIRTLIYHFGKTPRGDRTDWVIHEYRLEDEVLSLKNVPQDAYVLCVLFKKNGLGPRLGDQYGAPFREEDWCDEEDENTTNLVTIPSEENTELGPSKEANLVAMASHSHTPKVCFIKVISESCVSDVPPLTPPVLPPLTSDVLAQAPMSASPIAEAPQAFPDDDELNSLLDLFVVDNDECLFFDEFDYQNNVRHEPDVSVNEESQARVCIGVGNFSGRSDLGNELYIEMQDLIESFTPPVQASDLDDTRSNEQS